MRDVRFTSKSGHENCGPRQPPCAVRSASRDESLQPGPAALTDGLAALQAIIANASSWKTVAVVE
jgi:hypothetical protein